ncbi:hypothetical protein BDN72DRAFT_960751 [Pluteus cervinus]|uniref:Uncharacterized protein n=1 Tax=Pluteus cervinus TaxID=181527 RepID=A0ACD3APX8_9AGAR|nr:hypothetical protein BDN72DRAFT_960751 [Pluteus cervinus]
MRALTTMKLLVERIQRHRVLATFGGCVIVVIIAVIAMVLAVNGKGDSDFEVMASIPADASGVVLLGHIYQVDVDDRTLSVSWYVGGCGTYRSTNEAIAKGSANCSQPNVPLSIFMGGATDPVFQYDPTTQPISGVDDSLLFIQSSNEWQGDYSLDIFTAGVKLAGRYRYFDQQYLYPFDWYSFSTSFLVLDSSTNASVPIVRAALSDFADNFTPVSSAQPAKMNFNGTTFDSANVVTVRLSRNPTAKIYAIMLLVVNWALTASVVMITIIGVVSTETELGEGVLILPVTVILTVPALRALFIGNPPIGIMLDVLGFFLQMLLVSVCSVILLVGISVRSVMKAKAHNPTAYAPIPAHERSETATSDLKAGLVGGPISTVSREPNPSSAILK